MIRSFGGFDRGFSDFQLLLQQLAHLHELCHAPGPPAGRANGEHDHLAGQTVSLRPAIVVADEVGLDGLFANGHRDFLLKSLQGGAPRSLTGDV